MPVEAACQSPGHGTRVPALTRPCCRRGHQALDDAPAPSAWAWGGAGVCPDGPLPPGAEVASVP